LPGDLRDEAFCKRLVANAVRQLGGSTSSSATPAPAGEAIDPRHLHEDFDATMKTNIYAPFWIIKAALPHLKPGGDHRHDLGTGL
jgi:NAD(P)-dependent dehydrogenase (short-subunit alcohol dehydrogenase family)